MPNTATSAVSSVSTEPVSPMTATSSSVKNRVQKKSPINPVIMGTMAMSTIR